MDHFNPLFNPNRDRPKRPQTPNTQQYPQYKQQPNKSFNNLPQFSPSQFPMQHQNNYHRGLTKSRASVASSVSQLEFLNADHGEMFPQDLVFLLKNQEKNINQFKQKIEREKNRVQNDFAVFKTEIQHILEDAKISVQAELDFVYKTFITKYAQIKGQVQELRKLRKEILMSNNLQSSKIGHGQTVSNKDLISEIEKDAEHFRNYRIYGYLSELQKQKLGPILQISNELILIGSADCPFYKAKEMEFKLKQIKTDFMGSISHVYSNLKEYVVSPQAIVEREKEQEEQDNLILKNIENQQQFQQQHHYPTMMQTQNQYITPQSTVELKKPKFERSPEKKSIISQVSNSQTSACVRWGQSLSLHKIQKVITDHQDSILCLFFVGNNYIATGSRDKTICIYTTEGKKVTSLKGHDAAICSLTCVKNSKGKILLASGSDFGCCCLILWNLDSWTIASRIQSHTAAVTCILDLEDGENLLTGSYDKKINLFNHNRGQLVFSTSNSKSAIASMVMSCDKKKLITSGLDKRMTIWSIQRSNNIVNSIQVERVVNNNAVICSLEASLFSPEIVIASTYDGKIKSYNIISGQMEKVYTVNEHNIIELVVIERQMKSNSPLVLSCSPKDKNLCLTKMDSGLSEIIRINGAFHIQFGCGIGPKIVMSSNKGGIMAILNQSKENRQFCLYEMELK